MEQLTDKKNDKKNLDDYFNTKFIQFMGGRNLIYMLIIILFLGLSIYVFEKVSYIFQPIIIVFNTISAPIIVSLVLFYVFNPVINFMEKSGIKRILGISILYILLALLHLLLINALIPIIGNQINSFHSNLPMYIDKLNQSINQLNKYSIFSDALGSIKDSLNGFITHLPDTIKEYFQKSGNGIQSFIEKLESIAIVFMTVPFILFFMLKDGPKFKQFAIKYLPANARHDYLDLFKQIDEKVGSYIQGQMIVSICIGILLFIGYSIIGLKYALILALIAALTSVVPYLGPMIAISPAIVVALTISPIMLLKLAIIWCIVQFVESHFISPNVMGKTLKIHPLTIIFVLLCAGKIAGIIGVILVIPAYAAFKVIVSKLFSKFKIRYNSIYGRDKGFYVDEDEVIREVEKESYDSQEYSEIDNKIKNYDINEKDE